MTATSRLRHGSDLACFDRLIPPKQYVILNACDSYEEQRIDKRSAHRATAKMVREYERLIHREDLELLAQVHRERRFPGSSDLSRLMYNRLVLPYINSDRWMDIHPAVAAASLFREYFGLEQS